MRELPHGWIELPIGDVCQVVGGSTPSTKVAEYWGDEVPWLTPEDLSKNSARYVSGGRRALTKAGYASCSAQLMPSGSVLFTSRAPIGYVAIAERPLCTNQGFKSFVPPAELLSEYLYWFLKWATPKIKDRASGTTFAEISARVARTIPLRIPPPAEQDRIVAAIAEQFSRLDEAELLLRSAQQRALRLRSTHLARVTPEEGTGKWTTLGEVAEIVGGVTKDAKRHQDPSFVEVPYLRVANVQRGYLDLGEVTTIRVSADKAKALRLEFGDVLFNEGGDRDKLGRGWVWQGEVEDCIHQNHVFRARLLNERFDPKFVSMHGNTFGQKWFEQAGKQTTNLASISLRTLKSFPIPDLPVDEQRAIVSEVERQLTLTDALLIAVKDALLRSQHVRQAILARAFRGELVAQDPADEPAAELLARVEAARETSAQSSGRMVRA